MQPTYQKDEALRSRWPERRAQADLLLMLLSPPHVFIPGLFLFGASSTGKTSLILDIIVTRNLIFAYADCVQILTPSEIIVAITHQLWVMNSREKNKQNSDESENGVSLDRKNNGMGCRSVIALNLELEKMSHLQDETTYIILDNVAMQRDIKSNLIPALFRLGETLQRKICVILISSANQTDMTSFTGGIDIVSVFFPLYTAREMSSICCKTEYTPLIQEICSAATFKVFVDFVCKSFEHGTRDLHEIRRTLRLIQPQFLDFLEKSEGSDLDINGMVSLLRPIIISLFKSLYHHDMSASEHQEDTEHKSLPGLSSSLPSAAKYLLFAAFLASYNPAQQDRNVFSRNAARNKNTRHTTIRSKRKLDQTLLGPKSFPMDRMLAIFYCICGQEIVISHSLSNLYSHISSLISLNLLSHLNVNVHRGKSIMDEHVKLQCNVAYDDMMDLAAAEGLRLQNYLFQE